MKKINYYIGSNNKTHRLELEKALEILAEFYEGMSVSELIGYWKGNQEKTALISIVCETVNFTEIKAVCKKLNTALEQDAIMVEVLDSNTLFISDR
ncbi:MAG: hypothetical protein PHH83_05070 [Patescibacteria group bacterium]|jgi:hypothetical protein|nr:hypothetical protein [Patescibacteria group bacterium]